MPLKGFKHSEETKKKIKDNSPRIWLGKKMSDESRRKMSEAKKKLKIIPPSRKGIKWSLEGRKKLSDANTRPFLGKHHTEEVKQKLSILHTGKKLSDETKRKISESLKGEKSYLWKGGLTYEEYGINWTDILRESIRDRDEYTCQICGIHQDELTGMNKKLDVHHIDYNKKNLDPDNLITLCRTCHVKTNHNRDYWKKYFTS